MNNSMRKSKVRSFVAGGLALLAGAGIVRSDIVSTWNVSGNSGVGSSQMFMQNKVGGLLGADSGDKPTEEAPAKEEKAEESAAGLSSLFG